MIERDNRMVDVNVLRNLIAQLAVLRVHHDADPRRAGRAHGLRGDGGEAWWPSCPSRSRWSTQRLWEIKILLLLLIFVYALLQVLVVDPAVRLLLAPGRRGGEGAGGPGAGTRRTSSVSRS